MVGDKRAFLVNIFLKSACSACPRGLWCSYCMFHFHFRRKCARQWEFLESCKVSPHSHGSRSEDTQRLCPHRPCSLAHGTHKSCQSSCLWSACTSSSTSCRSQAFFTQKNKNSIQFKFKFKFKLKNQFKSMQSLTSFSWPSSTLQWGLDPRSFPWCNNHTVPC